MRLALVSDVHGNTPALDAVLADIARRGVDRIVCLGDIAAGGPDPGGAVARIARAISTGSGGVDAGLRQVAVDEAALAALVRDRGMPHGGWWLGVRS